MLIFPTFADKFSAIIYVENVLIICPSVTILKTSSTSFYGHTKRQHSSCFGAATNNYSLYVHVSMISTQYNSRKYSKRSSYTQPNVASSNGSRCPTKKSTVMLYNVINQTKAAASAVWTHQM